MYKSSTNGTAPGGYALGALPSPLDERDYRFPAYGRMIRAAKLPRTFAWRIDKIEDQGSLNSCVAHCLGAISDWRESRELGRRLSFSRQFIYANRNPLTDYLGPGMVPRQALVALRRDGVPPERLWPGIVEYGRERWPADRAGLAAAARPHRIATYVAIDPESISELKSAIYTTGPAMCVVPVHASFKPGRGAVIPSPRGPLEGYHAMVIVGWRTGAWQAHNSWGRDWGDNGRCWLTWDFPTRETWGITDLRTRLRADAPRQA